MAIYTAEDKFKEVSRESLMRVRVYPRLVAQGKIKQDAADRQIAIMQAIAEDYERLSRGERLL